MDIFSQKKRSMIMSAIKDKDTKPEKIVRSILHKHGLRFRIHRKDLPGRPDIVLPKYKIAILVHGCFWHGHSCPDGRRPKSNQQFWNEKLDKNIARDARKLDELQRVGWKAVVVWECNAVEGAERLAKRIISRKPEK